MISVGVDVSKGKSTVCVLKPYGEIVCSPFEVLHVEKELEDLDGLLQKLDGEIRIVMEASELDSLMYKLTPDHPALVSYKKVRSGAVDTVRSIIISVNARLAYMQNEDLLRILDHDDMDIPFLGQGVYENPERKTALFCVIPDTDTSFNFVVGMLYSLIFQELFYVADHCPDGRLPVPVALWMDE